MAVGVNVPGHCPSVESSERSSFQIQKSIFPKVDRIPGVMTEDMGGHSGEGDAMSENFRRNPWTTLQH